MINFLELRVMRLDADGILPTRAHPNDAGFDLYASESVEIAPGLSVTVGTGIALELPSGTEGQIRPRSGLARNHCVTVLNSPGTIDEDYRGEIKIVLINHGATPFRVEPGLRIAQLVVQRRLPVEVTEVKTVTGTSRGARGFGSTGD